MAKEFPVKWRFGVVDKLTAPVKRMTKAFNPVTKAAKRANIQFKLMQKNTEKLRTNIKNFGKGVSGVGKSMTLGLTAPITAFGVSTIKTAINFEQSMNKVAALTKATGKPLNNMRELAKKLGSETQFSASQAADAMSFLGMTGFNTNQILQATPAILDLAAASGTELARSADIASNIMGAFGLKAKDMTRVADVLAATTASANVDMEMLAESMKVSAPIAKMYGLSLEETSAAMGLLGNVGIQGSLAGNSLKNMMLNLTAPTSRAKKLIKGIGVDVLKTDGSMRSLTDILADLGPALSKIPKAKQLAVLNEVFGKRAIAGAGELVTQALAVGEDGVNAIERFTNSLKNADGTASKMAKTMQKGAPGAVKSLASAFEGLQIAIAESGVLEIFTDIVKGLTGILRKLSQTNPTFLKMASIAAVVVAAIGPLLVAFGAIIAMIPSMMTGFAMLKSGLIVLKGFAVFAKIFAVIAKIGPIVMAVLKGIGILVAALVSPIGLVVAGVVALVAALANLILRWDKIKKGFQGGFVKGVKTFFGFGDDDKKPTIASGEAKGAPLGADKITKQSNDFKMRQQKATVDVNFANMPKDTRVITDDRQSILNVNTGALGAI